MSEIGEAVGTVAEGGLYSRAVEKGDGEGPPGEAASHRGHFAENSCLNCTTPLTGPHCHQCGQKAHLHRTIRGFMHDLLHGALHFEGKMWSTLPMLVRKPGQLTQRYVAGERAKFVSPMALFLFSVFLMFAVFQLLGITTPENLNSQMDGFQAGYEEGRGEDPDTGRATIGENAIEPEAQTASGQATGSEETGSDEDIRVVVTGIEWIDRGIVTKWQQNSGLMLYKMQANSYKFSWLLIPLSLPFVWLLFAWKRRFKVYDHAIFVTYSLAFMSLLFITISVLGALNIPAAILALAAILIPPIHIYKQLRGAYGLARLGALWRLTVLLVFILIVLTLFLNVLLILGAF